MVRAVLFLIALAVAAAGCQQPGPDQEGPGGSQTNPFSSYSEAAAAPGRDFMAGPYEVKVVEPADDTVAVGQHRAVLVVSQGGGPVEDVTIRMQAHMPAMGHGACTESQREDGRCPEQDPAHEGHGVYVGRTSFSMAGEWLMQVQILTGPSDGQPEFLEIPVQVE